METKKAILEALEDKPKHLEVLIKLVPAFYSIAILGIGIEMCSQSLIEKEVK